MNDIGRIFFFMPNRSAFSLPIVALVSLILGFLLHSTVASTAVAAAAGNDLAAVNQTMNRMLGALVEISQGVDNITVKPVCECRCK
jgi:hypothetical protein